MSPTFSEPVWISPARAYTFDAKIDADEAVDLAVIGGGLQGLSTAFHAARAGLRVRVVEAQQIGSGASGLNGGQVIPGLKYDPEWLIQHFGEERGGKLTDFVASVADFTFGLIEREGLDVQHNRSGWIQACHTAEAIRRAEERHRQWSAMGADAQLLNDADIALMTGANGYVGGWLDRRAGVVNPLALTMELARLACQSGVRIVEGKAATRLRSSLGEWQVELADGSTLKAKKVLVATNAYSSDLVPGLAQSLVTLHSFQIATAPLPADLSDAILPHDQAVSDSRRILVYYRKSPDGRLVLGGRGRMGHPKGPQDWAHLRHAMLRLYPALEGIAIAKRWYGRVAMTPDHLPHLHEPEPGLMMMAGCQGRGVALMTAIGAPLAAYVQSSDKGQLPFPVSPIRPIPFHRFRKLGVTALITWYRMLDSFDR